MCPAHRDLPTPSHPHSRLNLPHPIPSHTYNGLKTFSLSTTPSGRSPPSAQTFVPSTVAYRHKSTNKNNESLALLKKSPRGVQRGRGFAAPLRFSKFPNLNKPPRSSGISPMVKWNIPRGQAKQLPHGQVENNSPRSSEKRGKYETKRKTILMCHPHRKPRRHHPSSTKNPSGSGLNRCGGYPQQHKTSESF